MVRDVNIRTSLILSYLYSTMGVCMSSEVRAAAPSWLKINYSCYFCPSVSMSVLPSGASLSFLSISLPSLTTSFRCFIPFASLASLPYLSLAPLTSLIFLGLVSVSSSGRSCKALVRNICKGNLFLPKLYT